MEFRENQAIYLQIADHLSDNILLGKLKPLDRIPSVREMAVNIEVNPNTVMRTYNFLQDKGIIFNKRGIGYFIAEDGLKKTIALRKEHFVDQELPRLFKEMQLLGMTIEDLKTYQKSFDSGNPQTL
ncbi:MAG: GntR family transcriptional regulator [Cyclobacteriaceae bacterium]